VAHDDDGDWCVCDNGIGSDSAIFRVGKAKRSCYWHRYVLNREAHSFGNTGLTDRYRLHLSDCRLGGCILLVDGPQ
jgi:hypothetical protein